MNDPKPAPDLSQFKVGDTFPLSWYGAPCDGKVVEVLEKHPHGPGRQIKVEIAPGRGVNYASLPVGVQPSVDIAALNQVCCDGGIFVLDGSPIQFVVPLESVDLGFMDFDKKVCDTGLKLFARKTMPNEVFPPHTDVTKGDIVIVRELSPGARGRQPFRYRQLPPLALREW